MMDELRPSTIPTLKRKLIYVGPVVSQHSCFSLPDQLSFSLINVSLSTYNWQEERGILVYARADQFKHFISVGEWRPKYQWFCRRYLKRTENQDNPEHLIFFIFFIFFFFSFLAALVQKVIWPNPAAHWQTFMEPMQRWAQNFQMLDVLNVQFCNLNDPFSQCELKYATQVPSKLWICQKYLWHCGATCYLLKSNGAHPPYIFYSSYGPSLVID